MLFTLIAFGRETVDVIAEKLVACNKVPEYMTYTHYWPTETAANPRGGLSRNANRNGGDAGQER